MRRPVCHLLDDRLQFAFGQCHLLQYLHSPFGRNLTEILFARRDDEAAHVQRSRAHEQFACGVAVGTVLLSWEDERHDLVRAALVAGLSPADDVHARFCLAIVYGQCAIKSLAEQAVGLLGHGAYYEYGTNIILQQEQSAALAGIAGILHLLRFAACEWVQLLELILIEAPVALYGYDSAQAGLQVKMVGA